MKIHPRTGSLYLALFLSAIGIVISKLFSVDIDFVFIILMIVGVVIGCPLNFYLYKKYYAYKKKPNNHIDKNNNNYGKVTNNKKG